MGEASEGWLLGNMWLDLNHSSAGKNERGFKFFKDRVTLDEQVRMKFPEMSSRFAADSMLGWRKLQARFRHAGLEISSKIKINKLTMG